MGTRRSHPQRRHYHRPYPRCCRCCRRRYLQSLLDRVERVVRILNAVIIIVVSALLPWCRHRYLQSLLDRVGTSFASSTPSPSSSVSALLPMVSPSVSTVSSGSVERVVRMLNTVLIIVRIRVVTDGVAISIHSLLWISGNASFASSTPSLSSSVSALLPMVSPSVSRVSSGSNGNASFSSSPSLSSSVSALLPMLSPSVSTVSSGSSGNASFASSAPSYHRIRCYRCCRHQYLQSLLDRWEHVVRILNAVIIIVRIRVVTDGVAISIYSLLWIEWKRVVRILSAVVIVVGITKITLTIIIGIELRTGYCRTGIAVITKPI